MHVVSLHVLNSKKTKFMLIRKDNKDFPINVTAEGIRLEVEDKYLGQWIMADSKCIKEGKRRIGRAKGKFW